MIAADLQRPAAIDQLAQLGEEINVGVYANKDTKDVLDVVKKGIEEAKKNFAKVIILDTAGRLHIDETLMDEVSSIKEKFSPQENLLVVDAMTGQDAVNVAEGFKEKVGIDGVILTKLDGDARGGAALSLRMVTGKPIKYIGVGEKLDDIEKFHPDRIVSRMLGMGDVLTLIEKAEESIKEEDARKMEEKLMEGNFTLQDFLKQIKMIKKMGSFSKLMKMIPGMPKDLDLDEQDLVKVESIIQSMTPEERRKPKIIKRSRKIRIANGCGRDVADVNRLLRRYQKSKKIMDKLGGKLGNKGNSSGKFPNIFN
jgi:signal recognition particle subunit SRP54